MRLIKKPIPGFSCLPGKRAKFGSMLVFVLFLSLSGCIQVSPSGEFWVKKIVDGDTIELTNGQMVRYLGIDTPETRHREGSIWVYAPEEYAEKAKDFNSRLVGGKQVRLEFDVQKKDRYGRLLAYCFAGDVFVNARMLQEGYATLYTFPPNVKYVDMFVRLQKEARENNRGLWGVSPSIPPEEAKHYVGKVAIVEGKVSSVRQSAKVTFLNFGRSGFKGVIFKEQFPLFMTSGVSIASYKGKTVRISGKVKEYKGNSEIIVRHPSDIEVAD